MAPMMDFKSLSSRWARVDCLLLLLLLLLVVADEDDEDEAPPVWEVTPATDATVDDDPDDGTKPVGAFDIELLAVFD